MQVFDFEPRAERADRLTPLERRLTRSPASAASKSRTQGRNSARAATAAYKGAMLAACDNRAAPGLGHAKDLCIWVGHTV